MKNRFEIMLEDLAARKGEVRFLNDARSGESVSYGEFLDSIRMAARAFADMGVKPGDRVLMMMDNSIAFAVDYFAITFCKGVAVPVNTNLKWKELLYIMEDTQAAGILIQEEYLEPIRENLQEFARWLGAKKAPVPKGNITYYPLYPDAVKDLGEEVAMLLYTSGTTGHPKGVILTFDNLMAKTEDIIEAHQFTDEDRVLCVLP